MSDSEPETYNIVVLGASYAGIRISRTILAKVLPNLSAKQKQNRKYKVVMVAPIDKLFMSVSSARVIAVPKLIDHPNLLYPFLDEFEPYQDQDQFEFVTGFADAVDFDKKVVHLKLVGEKKQQENEEMTLNYGSLVIATGSTTAEPALQALSRGTTSEMREKLQTLASKIESAKSISIGGGGITGVELASEIMDAYPDKEVTLYFGMGNGLTPDLPEAQRNEITQTLETKFKVNLQPGKVIGVNTESENGRKNVQIQLPDGKETTQTTDLYIPAVGHTPNTWFLPKTVLNDKGYVLSDTHLRVSGVSDVYVTGDASALSYGDVISIKTFDPVLQETISKELGTPMEERKSLVFRSNVPEIPQMSSTFIVMMGRSGGVGAVYGYRIPTWLVKLIKSHDALLSKVNMTIG